MGFGVRPCENGEIHDDHVWGVDYGDMGSDSFWCRGVHEITPDDPR